MIFISLNLRSSLPGLSFLLAAAILLLLGCNTTKNTRYSADSLSDIDEFVLIVYSGATREYTIYGQADLAEKRYPPCSTFKIISTLMGIDSGVIANQESRLGYDGTKYEIAEWNKDVTLRDAFKFSCVPYYKKLTGKLEKTYVQKTLYQLNYGNCDISVWNSNGHNVFWIESSLLISPAEQIEVLKKIFSGHSKFKNSDVAILQDCMNSNNDGNYKLYGKTGTGRNHVTNKLEAYYVGFGEDKIGNRLYFATHGASVNRNISSAELREIVLKFMASQP